VPSLLTVFEGFFIEAATALRAAIHWAADLKAVFGA
jgi:hypothetical protein